MQISLLVPFRAEPGSDRDVAWWWIKKWWAEQLPDAEVVTGTDVGEPFSKTTAVNDAYSRSTGDVLVVADADAILEPEVVQFAALIASRQNVLVVPWGSSIRLTKQSTEQLMSGEIDIEGARNTRSEEKRPDPITAGIMFVISRRAFETVNGMDPRFRGWGYEDVSFQLACETLLGKTRIIHDGWVVCLYHPRPKVGGFSVWGPDDDAGRSTKLLGQQHRNAHNRRDRMRQLVDQHPLGGTAEPIGPLPREPEAVTVREPLVVV